MKATTFLLGSLLIVPLMGWHALAGKHYTTKKGIQYYIEHLYQYTWFEAYFECAYRNMSLYTYGSQAEFNDLYELLTSDKFPDKPPHAWIGAVGVKGKFIWIKNQKPMTELHLWAENNPDNSKDIEHCLQIWHSKKFLNDLDCLRKIGFVCEIRRDAEALSPAATGYVESGKYKGLTINLYQNNVH
ncbi:lectin subunit alpha [Musca domestica]|uniref:Lectin subunit alpha-like n=1 Tax=Musca domestica TaxID=7370 RepID=A0A1I8M663_MUSDO|nr:lectin subunit alpha [Musca domestica]